jgi:hypothetical protein
MRLLQKTKNLVEVKMLQRCSRCDLNVMLLYAFHVIKFASNNTDFLDNKKFDKDFISKCFYCGCTSEQSGVSISYFIIQKVSFAVLVQRIKQDFPHEKKSYITAVVKNLLKILLGGLQVNNKHSERILIYDEEHKSITPLRPSVSNKSINAFIKSISFLYCLKTCRLARQPDNLSMLYNVIKEKLNKDINIYYTLYNNTLPVIPNTIRDNFNFCKKEYRSSHAGCITRNYIQNLTFINKNRKLKDLYDFVGLQL